jgi:hypothetical protein
MDVEKKELQDQLPARHGRWKRKFDTVQWLASIVFKRVMGNADVQRFKRSKSFGLQVLEGSEVGFQVVLAPTIGLCSIRRSCEG